MAIEAPHYYSNHKHKNDWTHCLEDYTHFAARVLMVPVDTMTKAIAMLKMVELAATILKLGILMWRPLNGKT